MPFRDQKTLEKPICANTKCKNTKKAKNQYPKPKNRKQKSKKQNQNLKPERRQSSKQIINNYFEYSENL